MTQGHTVPLHEKRSSVDISLISLRPAQAAKGSKYLQADRTTFLRVKLAPDNAPAADDRRDLVPAVHAIGKPVCGITRFRRERMHEIDGFSRRHFPENRRLPIS